MKAITIARNKILWKKTFQGYFFPSTTDNLIYDDTKKLMQFKLGGDSENLGVNFFSVQVSEMKPVGKNWTKMNVQHS